MAEQSEDDTWCEWCEQDPEPNEVPCSKTRDDFLRGHYLADVNETCRKAIEIYRPGLFEDNP